MVLVWLLLGVLMGPGTRPAEEGIIGAIAGAIAGVMLLPWLGIVLALMGGRPRETLVGGLWGFLVGAATAVALGQGGVLSRASAGLVAGGLTGATFLPLWRALLATWLQLLPFRRSRLRFAFSSRSAARRG
jgi:hypothetical protein